MDRSADRRLRLTPASRCRPRPSAQRGHRPRRTRPNTKLQASVRSFLIKRGDWSGRRGSNSRPSAWEADALPLSYSRSMESASILADARSCCEPPARGEQSLRRRTTGLRVPRTSRPCVVVSAMRGLGILVRGRSRRAPRYADQPLGNVPASSASRGRASVKSRGDFMDNPLMRGIQCPRWMTEGQWRRRWTRTPVHGWPCLNNGAIR